MEIRPPSKDKKKKSLTRSQSVLYSNNSNNNKKSQNQIDFDKSKKSQRNRCWPLRWKDISQRGLYIISYLPSIAHIYTYCIYKQFTIYSYLPFLFFLFCKKKIQHQIKWYISSFSFFFFFWLVEAIVYPFWVCFVDVWLAFFRPVVYK